MQREGQFILGNFQFAGGFINKLLQGTERTQPTTEHSPSPQQNHASGEGPENEDDRIHQEQLPVEVRNHRMDEGEHVDDGQLPQGIPANEDHGKRQVYPTQVVHEAGVFHQSVLQEQDHQQGHQGNAQHPNLKALLIPDVDPHRTVGFFDRRQLLCGRQGPLDILLGNLVRQLKAGEDTVNRTGLTAYQQL